MILSNVYKNGGSQDLNLQSHTTASTYPIGKPLHCRPAFYNCLILPSSEDYINALRPDIFDSPASQGRKRNPSLSRHRCPM